MTYVAGRIHNKSTLRPWAVPGGYVVAWSTWVRDPAEGWDEVIDRVDDTVYPTLCACQAAIELVRARSL
jgi:hypothetical protein